MVASSIHMLRTQCGSVNSQNGGTEVNSFVGLMRTLKFTSNMFTFTQLCHTSYLEFKILCRYSFSEMCQTNFNLVESCLTDSGLQCLSLTQTFRFEGSKSSFSRTSLFEGSSVCKLLVLVSHRCFEGL